MINKRWEVATKPLQLGVLVCPNSRFLFRHYHVYHNITCVIYNICNAVTESYSYCKTRLLWLEDVPTTAQYLLCVCDIFLLYWDDVGVVCIFRTFTHNMLAFGLSRKLCNDFLKKQAVIGNLNEGKARSSLGLVQFSCIHGSMFSYIGIIKGSYLKVEIII